MHDLLSATGLWILNVLIILFVHLRIASWEGRINVLWRWAMLGGLTLLHAVNVCLLLRAILVESAADKVSRVWQVWC